MDCMPKHVPCSFADLNPANRSLDLSGQRIVAVYKEPHSPFIVLEIEYPHCTNYEGRKISVYENWALDSLLTGKALDPHFCDIKDVPSPIARFEPTALGRQRAIHFVKMLNKERS